jgi:TM2 domain-containing membrane protein YozV
MKHNSIFTVSLLALLMLAQGSIAWAKPKAGLGVQPVPTSSTSAPVAPRMATPFEHAPLTLPLAAQATSAQAVTPVSAAAKSTGSQTAVARQASKQLNQVTQKLGTRKGFFSRVVAKLAARGLKDIQDGKVAAAIILCFFFGGLAIHRVVMGGTGLLILWYFLTCGGIFGIVPFIDFIMLIIDPSRYEGSNRFFAFSN